MSTETYEGLKAERDRLRDRRAELAEEKGRLLRHVVSAEADAKEMDHRLGQAIEGTGPPAPPADEDRTLAEQRKAGQQAVKRILARTDGMEDRADELERQAESVVDELDAVDEQLKENAVARARYLLCNPNEFSLIKDGKYGDVRRIYESLTGETWVPPAKVEERLEMHDHPPDEADGGASPDFDEWKDQL